MPSSPLIQVEELRGLMAGPEPERPVVLDVRYRLGVSTGRQDFELAHIPGASYVDMETELATIRPDGVGGRHPMPTVETFTTAMRSAGVTMSRHVVAYDDWDSLTASRVWWMLRHLGFLGVRVLDGGIAAWTAAGLPTDIRSAQPDNRRLLPVQSGLRSPPGCDRCHDVCHPAPPARCSPSRPVPRGERDHRCRRRSHSRSGQRARARQCRPVRAVPAGRTAGRSFS